MPVIAVLKASRVADDETEIAPTRRRTPGEGGGAVPTGLAGYVYDGAAYCPDCAEDVTAVCADDGEEYTLARFPSGKHDPSGFGVGIVPCTDEWDYPGAACDVCHALLDTNVLVYDGHNAHPYPEVTISEPGSDEPPVAGFVLEDPDDEAGVEVILAPTPSHSAEPGEITTVARHWIEEELDD